MPRKFTPDQELLKAYGRAPDPKASPDYKTSEMAQDLATELKLAFRQEVRGALDAIEHLPKKARLDVELQSHNLPSVEVYDTPELVKRRLADLGYPSFAEKMRRDESLLVIQLPEPMRPFPIPEGDESRGQINWAAIYNLTIDRLWETARDFAMKYHEI